MGGRGSRFKEENRKNYVKTIDMTDEKVVKSFCKQTLDKLAEVDDFEESYVVLENGEVYHFKGSGRFNVEIPDEIFYAAKIDLHSHPHDEVRSFSDEDRTNWFVGTTHYLTDGKFDYIVYVKKEILFDAFLYPKAMEFARKNKLDTREDQHVECLYLQSEGCIDYERLARHFRI